MCGDEPQNRLMSVCRGRGVRANYSSCRGLRASHSRDVYDFYKPKHSEYAEVDGKLSQVRAAVLCPSMRKRVVAVPSRCRRTEGVRRAENGVGYP